MPFKLSGCSDPDAGGDAATPCDGSSAPCPYAPGDLVVTVIDDEDGSVISGIPVRITGPAARSSSTDGSGTASFNGLAPGSYTVTHSSSCVSSVTAQSTVTANQTTTAQLRVRHTHAVIAIQQLDFTGHNIVEKDTTGNFPAPEWIAGRVQADQCPVAYARNTKVRFTARFRVVTPPCRTENVAVKGTATFGAAVLQWSSSVSVAPGAATVSVALTSDQPLANEIGIFESNDISWEMNPATRGWASAGTSRNVLYVTLGNPSGSPNFWTLLDISCRAAAGKSNENDFVTASFVPYRASIGNGNGFRRKRDGTELTYYKNGAGTSSSGVFTCSAILGRADGTGRCGGWADFLVAMHRVHGVTSSSVFGVQPISTDMLIVKNCTFSGAGTRPEPFTHRGETECVKNNGIPGQGKNNPQFTFGDHALVKHATGIYDPSYGVGPKPDLKTWEDGGIVGIGPMPYASFTFDGDTHIIPRTCSPGFIRYVLIPGETLSDVATKFGAASAGAIYGHRYNAALRGLRASAGAVTSGDAVVIPREIASKLAIMKII